MIWQDVEPNHDATLVEVRDATRAWTALPGAVVLTVDPQVTHWGFARWRAGVLEAALELDPYFHGPAAPHALIVSERPESRGGRTRTPVDDLLALAIAAGQVRALCPAAPVLWIRPSRWKGQQPKSVQHAHAREVLAPAERATWDALPERWGRRAEDARDAVCLGLVALGRL